MDPFAHIIGNDAAKQYLSRTVARDMIGNSLLFAGPEGVGKSLFALAFAQLLLGRKVATGNHPDLHVYRPEGKVGMHSIASMRQFCEEVSLAPFEGKRKIFIIHDADRMLSYSANALLKTFEEPSADSIIILLSSAPASLLPTVLSRCRTIYFQPLTVGEIADFLQQKQGQSADKAQAIAGMAQGSLGKALRLAQEGDNPLRGMTLDLLARKDITTYKQLSQEASALAEHIDLGKKQVEADIRAALLGGATDNLSAVQKQTLEKEVEGVMAMKTAEEAHALFEIVLGWYRDMELLHVNGNRGLLIHPDYMEACEQALQRGAFLPLEFIYKSIGEARLSLERSTSLSICFENLFLKLNLLK